MTDQHLDIKHFRSLHTTGRPLVLVNAWDAASARIAEAAGARAIATTSAGVAWSLGAPDGDALGRDLAVDLIARIVATVSVPVTADIESGYGATPDDVAVTVRRVLDAGAAGVNIEDALHTGPTSLRDVDDQCTRLAAARAATNDAGLPLYINARVDTYLRGVGGVDETVARANAYLAAGADGVFVPGVTDRSAIAALVSAISAPVNVLAGPGAPSVPELAELGVARVSLGSSVAEAAYAVMHRATEEAMGTGTYATLTDALDYTALNTLLHH